MSEESVAVPLRPRIVRRAEPTTPEGIAERAREDAEAAMAQATSEADALREFARQEGFAQGRAEAEAEVADTLATLRAMARGLSEQRDAIEEAAVREATALAVEVAARIVRADVAANPDRVSDVLRGAIRRAADRSQLVARVSPIDLAACREAAPTILEEMGGIARFEVVDDPRIMPGSCVLETTTGDVDATFESQLGRVLEALVAPPDEDLVLPHR
jgi:flagellar assembly protein FliH